MELIRSGVPAKDAFGQAFPNGVPTAEDRQKELAKAQQESAFGGVGGLAAGALGSKAIYDAVTGQKILGGAGGKLMNALGLGGTETAAGVAEAATSSAAPIVNGQSLLAGGEASGTLGSTAPTGIDNFAGSATPYLGAAGAAYGGYNAIQGIEKGNPMQAGTGALGLGLGLNAMGYALGPYGWAAMAAAPIAAKLLDRKSTKEIQADRWKAVGKEGMGPVDYFAGTGGEKSRDESFLTADAIRSNPDNYNAASDWDKFSKAQQDKFLNTLLQEKKVSERKGGIYYDDDRAKALADQIRAEGASGSLGQQLNLAINGPVSTLPLILKTKPTQSQLNQIARNRR